jgi:putative heme-binding domain-containing protein
MPRVGSRIVDEQALELLYDWIAGLKPPQGEAAARSGRAEVEASLAVLRDGADSARGARAAALGRLTATTAGAIALAHALGRRAFPEPVRRDIIAATRDHPAAEVRDLFERFVPEAERIRRLGDQLNPEEILGLKGDAGRGRAIFAAESVVNCKSCHRRNGVGVELGPDLSKVGAKYPRPELLRQILEPSLVVDPKYRAYLLETTSGTVRTGLLVGRTEREVVLRDAQNQEVRVTAADVERLDPQKQSLMPDLLLRGLTAQQAADLLEYLATLR